ncbi:MAG: hypothetical protein A2135_06515 [Actinobacteria bacterium RBG_16_67_15]|nr:MAG: hypothetical protein A2135_06515 [Actinobacteria bacterium RBG_16_67_15]
MPTARGWAALGVAGALLVLWIGFGEVELMTTAVFLLAAVVVGLVLVGVRGSAVSLTRRLSPAQAHEGDTVVVEVEVAAARRLRNVIVEDAVHGLGVARFAAATIAGPAVARYEVHCRFRGAYAVGPAEVSVMDPFGLSELRYRAGTTDRLLVYPRVERLSGLPEVRGLDPAVHAARPTFAPHGGEDFFTLREYQVGDDLRRVHWPSSAKRDSLVIKQLEVPWQARALVLLDVRAERYPIDEAFEHAVRGAAAAISHLHEAGFSPELWVAPGVNGPRPGNRYHQAMDTLATVRTIRNLDHQRTLARLRRKGIGGGVLVFVTGGFDEGALSTMRLLGRDFSRTVVMVVSDGEGAVSTALQRAGAVTVMAGPDGRWALGWKTAMEASWSTASAG